MVVLGSGADEVIASVDLHGADAIVCSRWEEGQSASLACGLAELASCEAVVVTLGDQPQVSPDAIRRGRRRQKRRRRGEGHLRRRPRHPVLLEQELFEPLRNVSGDKGARNLLLEVQVRGHPRDDLGGGEDVDTPAELDALRAGGPVTGAAAK